MPDKTPAAINRLDKTPPSLPHLVRHLDLKMERELLDAAGLLEKWNWVKKLEPFDAEQKVFALAAALLPRQNSAQRIILRYHDIQNAHGEKFEALSFGPDTTPRQIKIAASILVTPDAPPECILEAALPASSSTLSASVTTGDVSAHARLQAQRQCDILNQIWKVRMTAPGAPQISDEALF